MTAERPLESEVLALDPDPSSSPIVALLILLFLHAFFAAAGVAVASFPRSRLKQLIDEGHRAARQVAALAEDTVGLWTTVQLTTKLLGFLALALALSAYARPLANWLTQLNATWSLSFSHSVSIVLITVVSVLVMFVVGDLIPRGLAARHPESLALLAAYPLSIVGVVASALGRLAAAISRALTGGQGHALGADSSFATEEQIKTLVDAGEEDGFIEEEEREMIYSVFELGDTLAREVMVPRIDVVALEVNTSITDALKVIVDAGHSRIPVYRDTIDNVVGMLYAKDLLRYWPDSANLRLSDILRDVYYIPETKAVDHLLQELQRRKVHIAVVVDEYGGIAGLVTIEDILEEIVGEIQDEYDTEEAIMEVIGPDEVVFNGRIDVDDVNRIMNIDLPTDSSDTISGLVYSSLGRVAVVGDRVQFNDVELTVLSVLGRRIKEIRITRSAAAASPPANARSWFGAVANGTSAPAPSPDTSDSRPEETTSKSQGVANDTR